MRNFLWYGGSPQTKRSLLNWITVCLPKSEGGLGFRWRKDLIMASSIHLGWTAFSSSTMWASWFKAKYFKGFSPWHPRALISGSCIWRQIKSRSHFLFQSSHWILGDGKDISFWHDKWHGPLFLEQKFPNALFPWIETVHDIFSNPQWLSRMTYPQQAVFVSSSLLTNFSLSNIPNMLIWSSSNSSHLPFLAAWETIRARCLPRVWSKFAWNNLLKPSIACFA